MLNLTVQASVKSTECLINQKHKLARQSRKDQSWRRLATKNKIAQVKGWNLPTYREKRNLETLLKFYGEYAYLTGKRLGTYYLSTLDLDIQRAEFPINRINRLFKNVVRLLDYLKVSYNLTKKGLHVDILTTEPLNNATIYWTDKLGKRWNVGSIQSLGKYVVGKDKNKTSIENGKWYWKALSNEEVKATLKKFFFELKEAVQSVDKPVELNQQEQAPLTLPNFKNSITQVQAKILSKQKVPWLTDIWKVFYLDCHSKKTNYFLWNDYQQKEAHLSLGAVKNIRLVQGRKHIFYSILL